MGKEARKQLSSSNGQTKHQAELFPGLFCECLFGLGPWQVAPLNVSEWDSPAQLAFQSLQHLDQPFQHYRWFQINPCKGMTFALLGWPEEARLGIELDPRLNLDTF